MSKSKPQTTDDKKFPPIDPADARDLIVSIATIMNNTVNHYWLSDADASTAAAETHTLVSRIITSCPLIAVRITDGDVTVNDVTVDKSNINMEMFVKHMTSLNATNFDLEADIREEDFSKLIEIFCAGPEEVEQLGGLSALIQDFGIEHVQHRKITLKEVEEGEVVVSEDAVDGGEGGPSEEVVGNILAFLKGDVASGQQATSKELDDVASDSAKMAELIMQAADVKKQSAPIEEGENMADFVVGCLKRTFSALKDNRSYHSKIGKKRLKKNLLLLEEEVLNRMREMTEEWKDEDYQAIHDATDSMTDEMQIDSIADEYMAKQAATEDIEQKVIDYIRSHNITDFDDNRLKSVFSDRGLGSADWQRLVIKSGQADGQGDGLGTGAGPGAGKGQGGGSGSGPGMGMGPGFGIGGVFQAIGQLETLLDQMEKQFETADTDKRETNSGKLMNTLERVHGQINDLTSKTERSLRALVQIVKTDAQTAHELEMQAKKDGVSLNMTRKEMLGVLCKVVHDISEPLEFIKSTIDMVTSKTLGGVNDTQKDALGMAMESAQNIRDLLDKLGSVGNVHG